MNSEWVNAYFDRGIDVVNRRVFIGDIDEVTVDFAIKGLYLMDSLTRGKHALTSSGLMSMHEPQTGTTILNGDSLMTITTSM